MHNAYYAPVPVAIYLYKQAQQINTSSLTDAVLPVYINLCWRFRYTSQHRELCLELPLMFCSRYGTIGRMSPKSVHILHVKTDLRPKFNQQTTDSDQSAYRSTPTRLIWNRVATQTVTRQARKRHWGILKMLVSNRDQTRIQGGQETENWKFWSDWNCDGWSCTL